MELIEVFSSLLAASFTCVVSGFMIGFLFFQSVMRDPRVVRTSTPSMQFVYGSPRLGKMLRLRNDPIPF